MKTNPYRIMAVKRPGIRIKIPQDCTNFPVGRNPDYIWDKVFKFKIIEKISNEQYTSSVSLVV